jgi:alpha-N-arabinofuranosidase
MTRRVEKGRFTCRVVVDRDFDGGAVDPRLCGSFVEHLGRVVYTGIFEPGHPRADSFGFREDVRDLVRELGVNTVRYPGGNFVSSYDWRDGIGPREERVPRLDPAWRALETNAFGLGEFMRWCEAVAVEPFLVFNLGTGGVRSACELVEYCNGAGGSGLAELRKVHGRQSPYGVRLWGLGNEMDGDWQIGSRSASEYASLASQVARAVKRVDDSVELVVAGSSKRDMASFPEWDRVVLEQTYDFVDYLGVHQYYAADEVDWASYAASGVDFEDYIVAGIATCDYVREVRRSKRRVHLAVDEWNVNYRHQVEEPPPWQVAPTMAEHKYDHTDAVVFGSLLIPLVRHADRVKIACQALLVNVGGPVLTEVGGEAKKQSIFSTMAAVFNRLRRTRVLGVSIDAPEVATAAYGDVPALDAGAVIREEDGGVAMFIVNRSIAAAAELEVVLRGWEGLGSAMGQTLEGSAQHGDGVLGSLEVQVTDKEVAKLRMAPLSWAVVEFQLT